MQPINTCQYSSDQLISWPRFYECYHSCFIYYHKDVFICANITEENFIPHSVLSNMICSFFINVGDYSGCITVCKLEVTGVKFITTLKGQAGSIRALEWDGSKNWLYSGSFDNSIFVWDIGKIWFSSYQNI